MTLTAHCSTFVGTELKKDWMRKVTVLWLGTAVLPQLRVVVYFFSDMNKNEARVLCILFVYN
jgi:hypothetical protein